MTCRVVLVQHGEKLAVAGDPGLTDAGWGQAAACAGVLAQSSWDGLRCSDLARAIETADVIGAACGVSPVVDARLRERMNWDDGPFEEFAAEWARRSPALAAQTAARYRAVLDDIVRSFSRALVVAHGGATLDLVRSLGVVCSLEGVPPCAVTSLTFERGSWRVEFVARDIRSV
jgi:broad specificity phosphatase PhoE